MLEFAKVQMNNHHIIGDCVYVDFNDVSDKGREDAPQQAKQRADELMAIGKRHAGVLWLSIYRQIKKTLGQK